jgi:hypothetical protein
MIFVDIDGTLIDFYGTTKKFGIELKINEFGKWKWSEPPFPTPEEFYAKAELQPWAIELILTLHRSGEHPRFITKDYGEIKQNFLDDKLSRIYEFSRNPQRSIYEAPRKTEYCLYPIDLLIDDNVGECGEWCFMGGIAYHFNLADENPFEKFLEWWYIAATEKRKNFPGGVNC